MARFILFALALAFTVPAYAGTHTNVSWSTAPGGNGSVCILTRDRACYYNFTAATDSPVLPNAMGCQSIFTRVEEKTADIQVDVQACPNGPGMACSNLPGGTDLAATGDGPEGGGAAALKVVVDTCTTCEGNVEVVCVGD